MNCTRTQIFASRLLKSSFFLFLIGIYINTVSYALITGVTVKMRGTTFVVKGDGIITKKRQFLPMATKSEPLSYRHYNQWSG